MLHILPYQFLKTGRRVLAGLCLAVLCIWPQGCVQSYVSPYKSPATGYLVVEGYISGNTATTYSLTRTIPLPGDSTIPVVTGATVQVEGNDNSVYLLDEQGNGVYSANSLPLSATVRYRLRISIPNGETYLSEFVPYKPTPPIDSVSWIQSPNGVTIYANTHDPTGSTRYYQWTYDQTWEYYSPEQSFYIYVPATNSVVPRTDSQYVYHCWMQDVANTNILISNSAKLAQDEIYEFPLVRISANSQPLGVLYSILVKQYALTDSAYNFLYLMQQNTEDLGSIFDAQPSQLTGNIQSLSNPDEPVIGYISAGTVQQQRIFISNNQLNKWLYYPECPMPDYLVPTNPDSIYYYFEARGWIPVDITFGPPPPGGIYGNVPSCLDCTLQGGTTQKPSFWPN